MGPADTRSKMLLAAAPCRTKIVQAIQPRNIGIG